MLKYEKIIFYNIIFYQLHIFDLDSQPSSDSSVTKVGLLQATGGGNQGQHNAELADPCQHLLLGGEWNNVAGRDLPLRGGGACEQCARPTNAVVGPC